MTFVLFGKKKKNSPKQMHRQKEKNGFVSTSILDRKRFHGVGKGERKKCFKTDKLLTGMAFPSSGVPFRFVFAFPLVAPF